MKYRISWPLWKLAYRLGLPMYYRYQILYDAECKRFIGECIDIKGLFAEGDTIEEVKDVIESCAPDFAFTQVYGK